MGFTGQYHDRAPDKRAELNKAPSNISSEDRFGSRTDEPSSLATATARDSSAPSNRPGLEIPVIGARAKTVHSHYGSLPISSPIRCVALSPLPVKTITVVSADRMTPASRSLLSAAALLAEVGST